MINEVFGNYRVTAPIGEGGMGAVYAAEHQLICRRVAIKVLHPEMSESARFASRFADEARVLTLLRHPGIVGILDYGVRPDGTAYLVMEYLDGLPLSAWLEQGHGRSAALLLLRQIAEAVAAAHVQNVVHRDLKPANVIIIPDAQIEGGARAVVVDFGIARIIDVPDRRTRSGTIGLMGSPRYMAPEQCRGETVTERTDVYALGVMLYEVLAGAPLFGGKETVELLTKHVLSPPPPLRARAPTVPPALEQLVLDALAKEPARRPTMLELAARLGGILEQGAALPADTPLPLGSTTDRHVWQRLGTSALPRTLKGRWTLGIGATLLLGTLFKLFTSSDSAPAPAASKASGTELGIRPQVSTAPTLPPGEDSLPASGDKGPAEGSRRCYIRIDSTPKGAQVFRDGRPLGSTPYIDSLPYSSSPVLYRVLRGGYKSFETTVTPDHRRTINVVLKPREDRRDGSE